MKKLLSLALALCMLLGVGATALAEDVPTFTVDCNRWTEVWGTDFTQTAFLKEIGEKTGVNIEWQPYWNGSWGEQKSLMLASGLSGSPGLGEIMNSTLSMPVDRGLGSGSMRTSKRVLPMPRSFS